MSDNMMMGDLSQMTSLPEKTQSHQEEAVAEIKRKAKYSRSKEFQDLRNMMESRIEFYKQFLPDGTPIALGTEKQIARNWPIANIVIAELSQVIEMYDNAEAELKEIDAQLK
jgi:hypothetical protein